MSKTWGVHLTVLFCHGSLPLSCLMGDPNRIALIMYTSVVDKISWLAWGDILCLAFFLMRSALLSHLLSQWIESTDNLSVIEGWCQGDLLHNIIHRNLHSFEFVSTFNNNNDYYSVADIRYVFDDAHFSVSWINSMTIP